VIITGQQIGKVGARARPRWCRPGCGELDRAPGLRCFAWSRPSGLAGGWDL